jgi:hypothetical protein
MNDSLQTVPACFNAENVLCCVETGGRIGMRVRMAGIVSGVVTGVVSVMVALAGGAQDAAWDRQTVDADAAAFRVARAAASAVDGRLVLSNDGDSNGLALPLAVRGRREVAVETVVTVRRRLAGNGWNFAGVVLVQDDWNFWMLALVEGADGKRSVDFLESHAGVWQAQNEAATALKREGNVSFAWQSGAAYRLRLAFRGGRVCADLDEAAGGRALASASFALGAAVPAVRSGRPGLIVRGSEAAFAAFAFSKPRIPAVPAGVALADGKLGRLALLDDALPGHDRAANARLAAALAARGFGVTRLTAEQLVAPDVAAPDLFPILVLPQCASLPAQAAERVAGFAREGGHTLFIGGPFLDDPLWRVDGRWLDAPGRTALVQRVEPAFQPFAVAADMDLAAWRRSCADPEGKAAFRVVPEGPGGAACLRLDIERLRGWEVRHSPALARLYGEGHDFLTFLAKSGEPAAQLAVEMIEQDGSRWIATAEVSNAWQRVGLPVSAFRFWPDASVKRKRGGEGDRLDPRQAVRVCFEMSASHTPAMVGGTHTVWLAEIGSARDPFAAAGLALPAQGISLEGVYPRYKTHTVTGDVAVAANGGVTAGRDVVCAIPRTLGEGFGRGAKWRFLPLADARRADGKTGGVCEWLLLNTRAQMEGAVVAGFGYNAPAVWSSERVLARIAATAERLAAGALFEEAGTEQFAYWPGEAVRIGARTRVLGGVPVAATLDLEVTQGGRAVWRERVARPLKPGVDVCGFTWQPPAVPGEYTFRARLTAGTAEDTLEHTFAVLDPAPAPRTAFISAKDGDFWLAGGKWYPVGVNFWPLYVSGMDHADYGSGWLRDPYYAPAQVERDLEQLAGLGINLVSIQTPPLREHRNLLDFLRRCARHGLYANLYMGQASPLAFNETELRQYVETARLPGHAAVFAYDTVWEPGNHVFKDDAARARWDAAWRAWIDERYGSLERAEKDWGVKARRDKDGAAVSPADAWFRGDGEWRAQMAAYRRFMDTLTSRLWGRANRRLRELDPNHLVSFRQGNTLPYDFALSGPVKHIDFICPEGYSIHDTDEGEDAIGFITRYVDFTAGGKPIVWSEFGMSVWDSGRMKVNPVAVQRQGNYSKRFYRTGLAAGANGTAPWWWVGGYRVEERSDFGIVELDRAERPAARLIRDYGPRFKAPRDKPVPSEWFTFDRDAHAGGYWRAAFSEGAAAYRAAAKAGKTLGVRSPGTGTDSANVPLVAVGNVPCDGTNPPKYLDAEFNRLEVFNADGVWQEAGNGAEITVSAGRPVRARASVGNTQEAAWLLGAETVGLSVREKNDGRPFVHICPAGSGRARVPYLADADFGEFNLLGQYAAMKPDALTKPVALAVQMELLGRGPRIPFGEARVFTLKYRETGQ